MDAISDLLSTPLVRSILEVHPNDLALNFVSGNSNDSPSDENDMLMIHPSWQSWWNWAAGTTSTSVDTPMKNTSACSKARWVDLVQYYITGCVDGVNQGSTSPIPQDLVVLIDNIRALQLPRHVSSQGPDIFSTSAWMSPKKAHEVSRMTEYISHLLSFLESNSNSQIRHAVDVGAGQGYLTRALRNYLSLDVLAIDSNEEQIRGAKKWEDMEVRKGKHPRPHVKIGAGQQGRNGNGSITHETIDITGSSGSENFYRAVDDWISEQHDCSCAEGVSSGSGDVGECHTSTAPHSLPQGEPTPVLVVALHACGSLTPDILRSFLTFPPSRYNWVPAAVVVVGCCYNLMEPGGTYLTSSMTHISTSSSFTTSIPPKPFLPVSAIQLATQIPSQWFNTPSSFLTTELGIRKVVWRALLGRLLREDQPGSTPGNENENDSTSTKGKQERFVHPKLGPASSAIGRQQNQNDRGTVTKEEAGCSGLNPVTGTGATLELKRLGRLGDTAYVDWETFLGRAGERMGRSFGGESESNDDMARNVTRRQRQVMESRLEVLHVLRCLLGTLVESLIIMDRVAWIEEELETKEMLVGGTGMTVKAVNLFDQATGSGRNVAIVISPRKMTCP